MKITQKNDEFAPIVEDLISRNVVATHYNDRGAPATSIFGVEQGGYNAWSVCSLELLHTASKGEYWAVTWNGDCPDTNFMVYFFEFKN